MVMIRFLRDEPSSVDRSGLTGDPDIPDPPPKDRVRGIRARLKAAGPVIVGTFRGMPRMTRLVWNASRLMTAGLTGATVVSGLIPVAQAWTSRLLVNAVVQGIRNHAAPIAIPLPWGGHAPPLSVTRALIALAVVQFGLYLVNAVTTEIRSVAQQCLQERISQVVQLQVMEKAGQLDMAFFEDSRSYDLLRQTQQEAAGRPLQMVNGALGLLQATITLTSMLAVLIGLNPWLALVVLLAAIPEFISDARFSRKGFMLAMRAAPIRRRMQYLATLVTTDTPGTESRVLDDVSVEISPGETVALVGRNGAGKSTFVKLLCRLYDPDEGRILLDGIDITTVDPAGLRAAIGGMFQDFVTYQATAGENIGLGEVTRIEDAEAVAASARNAGAATLIEGLPRGYDTALGKWFGQGTQLSGGQWQKVALARSFMRAAPIIVLDEPTSALDAQAEHELFARLRSLAEGRTAIFISHRFSTVRKADRILLFHEGQLAEQGTHAELMRLAGSYAELFTLQASAYLD
jgi:ABC-type multidrug transport system fused ATPase/permease subunit